MAMDENQNHESEDFDFEPIRSRLHNSVFTFVNSCFGSRKNEHEEWSSAITSDEVSQIFHHVNSMIYAHLITVPSDIDPEGMHPAEAAKIIQDTIPILKQTIGTYEGREIGCASMLIFDLTRVIDSVFGWK